MNRPKHIFSLLLFLAIAVFSGDTVRPGLERLEYNQPSQEEEALIQAIKEPFLAGLDVSQALQDWFDGRLLDTQNKKDEAAAKWKAGITKLSNLKQLPQNVWEPIPDASLSLFETLKMSSHPDVNIQVVEWTVDNLKQYGVIIFPKNRPENAKYPLILYCHGAAFGLPQDFMGWLANLVEKGYVIIGPAMRGEQLFQWQFPIKGKTIICEGEIENLDGEVNDCLSMVSAAWKLPFVKKDEFAMIGHSFGSGVGLLAAARAGDKAKAVVSYDAWLVNPQRYCWDRMRRGPNNWLSWEDYCNQPVMAQLTGLLKRSIVHNADKIQCPMLLFMGGAYEGSVFHQSHEDLCGKLDALKKNYKYELVPNGDHNFVLRQKSKPALHALKLQNDFLLKHYPPYSKQGQN